jgi:hypothetical protein
MINGLHILLYSLTILMVVKISYDFFKFNIDSRHYFGMSLAQVHKVDMYTTYNNYVGYIII